VDEPPPGSQNEKPCFLRISSRSGRFKLASSSSIAARSYFLRAHNTPLGRRRPRTRFTLATRENAGLSSAMRRLPHEAGMQLGMELLHAAPTHLTQVIRAVRTLGEA